MLKLEVGKTYVNRKGEAVKIVRCDGMGQNYPFESADDVFMADGRHQRGQVSDLDLIREHTEESPFTGFVVGRWYRDAAGNVGECSHIFEDGEAAVEFGDGRLDDLFAPDGSLAEEIRQPARAHPIVAEVPAPQAQRPRTPEMDAVMGAIHRNPAFSLENVAKSVADAAARKADPNAAMLARDTYQPHQSEEVPLKPVSRAPKLCGVHIASPDLTPMGHQVAPHWANGWRE